jgi:ATP-binding cassette, subfamily B, bacterial
VLTRLRARQEWQFFAVLPKADHALAIAWWTLMILNGAMPALFAVATGLTVNAVEESEPVAIPLALTGVAFLLMLVVNPIQTAVSMNLGNKVSAWLNETLIRDCVEPPGIGHLEDPNLADDLTTAREFDRAMTGPPMYLNVEFIGTSLVSLLSGIGSALVLVGFAWWAPVVLVLAWGRRIGCSVRAGFGRTGTPPRCGRRSAMPTMPTGLLSIRNRPRSCGCSALRAGRSSAS